MDYRREVDGLRAIALIPVMLFHAGLETFSGGFVGVDVFFVISGYLITTIIWSELDQDKFSIVNFYERRVRRILPALFLVLLVSLLFAWLISPAREFKDYSQSLAAVACFSSNILFWYESGYFDAASELKPLLHTWSLALEEQYYFFFPLLLLLFRRLHRGLLLGLLGVLFVSSFALSQWAVVAKPATAFYLLPTRSWELLVGAFAAFFLFHKKRWQLPGPAREALGWLGVSLILYAVFTFSKATAFPGLNALAPTIGAVLIILFSNQETTVGRFVGNQAFVAIGLISYSTYLWHQPLFALARQYGVGSQDQAVFLALAVLSLLLGFFSWKFVESPFRSRDRISRSRVFQFAAFGTFFFAGIGVYGHVSNGFPQPATTASRKAEKLSNANFIVLGDSHGGHLIPGLRSVTSGTVEDLTSNGCVPFRNVDRYDTRFVPGDCAKSTNAKLDTIIRRDPSAVVLLSSMGPVYLDGLPFKGKDLARVQGLGFQLINNKAITDKYKVFEIGLRQTLMELTSLKNASIVLAIDVPELGIDSGCVTMPKQLSLGQLALHDLVRAPDTNRCFVLRTEYEQRASAYKSLVTRIASGFPAVKVFDPTDTFCDGVRCKGYDPKYGFLYRDADHLSDAGSQLFAERICLSLTRSSSLTLGDGL